jgi:hypothetical protein
MERPIAQSQQDVGTEYLTRALRQHFNFIGYAAVKCDVLTHRYANEKKTAALMWLNERGEHESASPERFSRYSGETTGAENVVTNYPT